ncbi:phosphate ABC transporter permease subunit PstC [Yoonia sediminilitoris]|uniref:Phosphate transport system permease protein n=1 Tax=Yoonia sediminilitoris TaxID=1286148 RepID=A0A2T6KS75_9RHOB|nr:phosphate ABC transporter permease subunit PstC [Yoonia sediminilitoris]PUB19408.1 phosphate ABC transporter membrane protein 1 (PhoT family) [Yoonia sediminilitoris]RCW99576.1 phosphate ABC transporter membrane protein 1 (PhoT family) [Yoonia sediminilitoris]
MQSLTPLLLVITGLAVAGYFIAKSRAMKVAGGDIRTLVSLPRQHALNTVLSTSVPALAAILLISLYLRLTGGQGSWFFGFVVIGLAVTGFATSLIGIKQDRRARTLAERWILGLLIFASTIAIMTTVGIVFSMLFETYNFFGQYDWRNFFFSTTWSPNFRGNSDLGILPLLWGTLYISFIALAFAVPIGLFAAIYLSEYAGPRMRSVAKPAIEVLAGIPTIVYGLFALFIVGPALRDYFAEPMGLGQSASSVMTAGLVMGIMLIPFVSSLSDDIINAVPQSMRDGSLGLGATKSETIRQVVIPAALPGVIGAVLLAASRAIGETMIVVLGAGAAARLSLNPFEAMTTVTVKIVSQLTGDTDFASPETLVAFALGLTLFVITLGLNVFALFIVRRYREQYE